MRGGATAATGSESSSPQTEPPSDQDSGSDGGRAGAAGARASLACGPLLPEPPLFQIKN